MRYSTTCLLVLSSLSASVLGDYTCIKPYIGICTRQYSSDGKCNVVRKNWYTSQKRENEKAFETGSKCLTSPLEIDRSYHKLQYNRSAPINFYYNFDKNECNWSFINENESCFQLMNYQECHERCVGSPYLFG